MDLVRSFGDGALDNLLLVVAQYRGHCCGLDRAQSVEVGVGVIGCRAFGVSLVTWSRACAVLGLQDLAASEQRVECLTSLVKGARAMKRSRRLRECGSLAKAAQMCSAKREDKRPERRKQSGNALAAVWLDGYVASQRLPRPGTPGQHVAKKWYGRYGSRTMVLREN